ncbi:hypothetical protein JCM3774_003813 [Rhodotorula dairenensis]
MATLDLPGGVRMRYERLAATAPGPGPPQTVVVLVPFTSVPLSTLPQLRPTSALRRRFDVVALAPRSHSETTAPITAESDHYVAAAEVALAYEALQIPPCPLFAPSTICSRIALAFAILFPDLVTSLAFVSLGGRSARRSIAQLVGFCELGVTSEDIVIEMFTELAATLGGEGQTVEERDDLVKFLLRQGGPRKTQQSYERLGLWYYEAKFPPNVLADVRQPCLLIYGANDDETLRGNDDWSMLMSGAKKVEVEIIPNTTKMCWMQAPDTVAEAVTRSFGETAVSPATTTSPPDFELALRILSTISHEPGVRDRDPRNPPSFTALTAEEIEARSEGIRRVIAAEESWCAARGDKPEPWDAPSPTSSAEDEQNPRWS